MGDFSFLDGRWRIEHRKLAGRLCGSTRWTTFESQFEHQTLLGGLASFDKTWTKLDGKPFEGVTLRTFEPATREWTIFWMDIDHPTPTEQVRGVWEGDRGLFYGTDPVNGEPAQMRFSWTRLAPDRARWEQAHRRTDADDWETDWIMDFHR